MNKNKLKFIVTIFLILILSGCIANDDVYVIDELDEKSKGIKEECNKLKFKIEGGLLLIAKLLLIITIVSAISSAFGSPITIPIITGKATVIVGALWGFCYLLLRAWIFISGTGLC